MKQLIQRRRPSLLTIALGMIILLLALCGSLYKQNRFYSRENRRLIIENDSIMSVNIELSKTLKVQGSISKN